MKNMNFEPEMGLQYKSGYIVLLPSTQRVGNVAKAWSIAGK